MKEIEFEPIDTLFFRDGSPFNKGELQSGLDVVFPPPPQTLAGAVRAAWARALGWDGRGGRRSNWDRQCKEHLGSGEDPGRLSFHLSGLKQDGQALFPCPACLLGKTPKGDGTAPPESVAFLAPGKARHCDLGTVRLPELIETDPVQGRKTLCGDYWITAKGLELVLRGSLPQPAQWIHRSRLWTVEERVGIVRGDGRTTEEQGLYAPRHIRLHKGIRLFMEASGLPQGLSGEVERRPQPTGGESRCCWMKTATPGQSRIPAVSVPKTENGGYRYTVVVVTPWLPSGQQSRLLPGASLASLPGQIVSLCAPRPLMIGGWDTTANRPLALQPHLAPGTVIFMESGQPPPAPAPQGERTGWGYGQIAIGHWSKNPTRSLS